MISELTIDGAGRVTLPKALRQELHLEPGDTLRLEAHGDQIILLPVRLSVPICKEDGIWVYCSGQPSSHSINKLIEEGRNERHFKNLGVLRSEIPFLIRRCLLQPSGETNLSTRQA